MRIVLDASFAALASSQKAGIYQYILNLILELGRIDAENKYILSFSFFRGIHLQTYHEFCSLLERNCERRICRIPRVIRRGFRLPIELFVGHADIYHGLCSEIQPTLSAKSIVTIHDLVHIRRPEFLEGKLVNLSNRFIPLSARRADLIITISSFSKNDIVGFLHIPEDKVRVVPHGVSSHFAPIKDKERLQRMKERYQISDNYILFVGTLQPSKNVVGLIEAFSELKNSSNLPHKLVIAGTKGWLYDDIFRRVKELNLEEDVIFTGHINHKDLPELYSAADLFILPSLFESFGIPVLEAMACGTPVVASKACALPETAGDAAVLVDPHSIDDIAEGIYRVLSASHLQVELRRRGIQRAKEFTWEKTAKQTLGLYREICGEP